MASQIQTGSADRLSAVEHQVASIKTLLHKLNLARTQSASSLEQSENSAKTGFGQTLEGVQDDIDNITIRLAVVEQETANLKAQVDDGPVQISISDPVTDEKQQAMETAITELTNRLNSLTVTPTSNGVLTHQSDTNEIKDLKRQLADLNARFCWITEEYGTLHAHISESLDLIENFKVMTCSNFAKEDDVINIRKSLSKEFATILAEFTAIKKGFSDPNLSHINTIRRDLSALTREVARKTELDDFTIVRNDSHAQTQSLVARSDMLDNAIDTIKAELIQDRTKNDTAHATANTNFESIGAHNTNSDMELSQFKEQYAHFQSSTTTILASLNGLRTEHVADLADSITSLANQFKEHLSANEKDNRAIVKKIDTDGDKVQARVEALTVQLNDVRSNYEKVQSELASTKEKVTQLTHSTNDVQVQLHNFGEDVIARHDELEGRVFNVESLEEDNFAATNNIKDSVVPTIMSTVQALTNDLSSWKALSNDTLSTTVTSTDSKALGTRVDNVELLSKSIEDRLQQHQHAVDAALITQMNSTIHQLSVMDSSVRNVEDDNIQIRRHLMDTISLTEQNSKVQCHIKDRMGESAEIQAEIQTFRDNLAELSERFHQCKNICDNRQTLTDKLNSRQNKHSTKISNIRAEIQSLWEELGDTESGSDDGVDDGAAEEDHDHDHEDDDEDDDEDDEVEDDEDDSDEDTVNCDENGAQDQNKDENTDACFSDANSSDESETSREHSGLSNDTFKDANSNVKTNHTSDHQPATTTTVDAERTKTHHNPCPTKFLTNEVPFSARMKAEQFASYERKTAAAWYRK